MGASGCRQSGGSWLMGPLQCLLSRHRSCPRHVPATEDKCAICSHWFPERPAVPAPTPSRHLRVLPAGCPGGRATGPYTLQTPVPSMASGPWPACSWPLPPTRTVPRGDEAGARGASGALRTPSVFGAGPGRLCLLGGFGVVLGKWPLLVQRRLGLVADARGEPAGGRGLGSPIVACCLVWEG